MTKSPIYKLRYFFEWGGDCLWPLSQSVYQDFGDGPYDVLEACPLPLSLEILIRCRELGEWYDTSLNWEYPPDPSPWEQEEFNRFNRAALELLEAIRSSLGEKFEVVDVRPKCSTTKGS